MHIALILYNDMLNNKGISLEATLSAVYPLNAFTD